MAVATYVEYTTLSGFIHLKYSSSLDANKDLKVEAKKQKVESLRIDSEFVLPKEQNFL